MRPAGRVLFGTATPRGEEALFRDAGDLARFLIDRGIVGDKKQKSVATYLGQVLLYSDHRSRPASEALREQLHVAVRTRLGEMEPDGVDEWIRKLEDAFAADDSTRAKPSQLNAELLFQDVVERTRTSLDQFIVTARPAELIPSDRARTLNELLLGRLGLEDLASGGSLGSPRGRYTFNFPNEAVAHGFWRSLAVAVEAHARIKQVKVKKSAIIAALHLLHADKCLRVQRVPPFMCACPTVVFEPDDSRAAGFNLYYHTGVDSRPLVSVAQLDRASLEYWRNEFYLPIVRNTVEVVAVAPDSE